MHSTTETANIASHPIPSHYQFTNSHNITKILFKVALNTLNQTIN